MQSYSKRPRHAWLISPVVVTRAAICAAAFMMTGLEVAHARPGMPVSRGDAMETAPPVVLAQSRIERKERELAIRRARKERELQDRRARKEAEIMERNFARRRGFEDDRRYGRGGFEDRRRWQRDDGFAERPFRGGPVYQDRRTWGAPQNDWRRDPYRSQQRPPRGGTFIEDDDAF
jgi:hypothetical protein